MDGCELTDTHRPLHPGQNTKKPKIPQILHTHYSGNA